MLIHYNTFSPKKAINRLNMLTSYLKGLICSKSLPVELSIEVTNRCNLKCIMCPRNKMTRKVGDMDFSLFKKIIDEVKDYMEFIWLQDLGEPLLHKDIFKMIKYCKDNKVKTGISTNATILNKDIAKKLIESGLNHIVFAFDGATKEVYEKVRKGAEYDSVVKNIKDFLEVKNELNSNIFVTVQMIYIKDNEDEINKFRDFWDIKGVNIVRVRYYHDQINNKKLKVTDNRSMLDKPCFFIWHGLNVKWDGDVVPCCWDFNGDYIIGNVKKNSIKEIWNSKKMRALRDSHVKGNYKLFSICKRCDMPQPRLPFIVGSCVIDNYSQKQLIPRFEKLSIVNKKRIF